MAADKAPAYPVLRARAAVLLEKSVSRGFPDRRVFKALLGVIIGFGDYKPLSYADSKAERGC